jgi:hypothetical protein
MNMSSVARAARHRYSSYGGSFGTLPRREKVRARDHMVIRGYRDFFGVGGGSKKLVQRVMHLGESRLLKPPSV